MRDGHAVLLAVATARGGRSCMLDRHAILLAVATARRRCCHTGRESLHKGFALCTVDGRRPSAESS